MNNLNKSVITSSLCAIALLLVFSALTSFCDYTIFDHIYYTEYYSNLQNLDNFSDNVVAQAVHLGSSDVIFALWAKICSLIGLTYRDFHLSLVIFYVLTLYSAVCLFTKKPFLSFFIIVFNYYAIGLSTSALRLVLSIAFFCIGLVIDKRISGIPRRFRFLQSNLLAYFSYLLSFLSHQQMFPVIIIFLIVYHSDLFLKFSSIFKLKKSSILLLTILLVPSFLLAGYTLSGHAFNKYMYSENFLFKVSSVLSVFNSPNGLVILLLIFPAVLFLSKILMLLLTPRQAWFVSFTLLLSTLYIDRLIFIPLCSVLLFTSSSKQALPKIVFLLLVFYQFFKLVSTLPLFVSTGFFYN